MKLGSENLDSFTDSDFLYNQLPGGFISFKQDGAILRVNETFANWFEKTPEEICALNFKDLLTKASVLYYNMVIDPLISLRAGANEINLKFVSAEGAFDTLFNAVGYRNETGSVVLINAAIIKISDRKKYESALLDQKRYAEEEKRKFEFLSNSIPNHVWTASTDHRFLFVNQKFKDYFGISKLMHFDDFDGVYEPDRAEAMKVWKESELDCKRFEKEVRLVGLSQHPEWFILSAEPLLNAEGGIDLWIGSSTNIHKQKCIELANHAFLKNSLFKAQETLEENAELFVSIAMDQSHMIRKPLANIMGLIRLFNREDLTAHSNSLLDMLTESSAELDRMIRQATVNKIKKR